MSEDRREKILDEWEKIFKGISSAEASNLLHHLASFGADLIELSAMPENDEFLGEIEKITVALSDFASAVHRALPAGVYVR